MERIWRRFGRASLNFVPVIVFHPNCSGFVPTLVENVADMSPRVFATPTMSAENGRRHNVADAVTGSQYPYLRRDICEASRKLARRDRCLPMSSWASHNIARVADISRGIFMTCLHVDGRHVVWGGPAT